MRSRSSGGWRDHRRAGPSGHPQRRSNRHTSTELTRFRSGWSWVPRRLRVFPRILGQAGLWAGSSPHPAFQPRRAVASGGVRSPVTVAGQPRTPQRSLRCTSLTAASAAASLSLAPWRPASSRAGRLAYSAALARGESIVLLNTGHGKGKSSAAFGVMAQVGAGMARRCSAVHQGWQVEDGRAQARGSPRGRWHTLGDGFTWSVDRSRRDGGEGTARGWRRASSHQVVDLH